MSAIFDLLKVSLDFVDNPFWSVQQVKVKYLEAPNTERTIADAERGKVLFNAPNDFKQVLLFVNLSLDKDEKAKEELSKLNRLCDKYGEQGFSVYGTFPNDVQGGDLHTEA